MGEYNRVIYGYQLYRLRKLDTAKSLKAEVSSVSPSSERFEELSVVWVYMQKMELRCWWEYGDEETRIN